MGIDESTFQAQSLIQDGVIRQLEIIGEAVKRISPTTRDLAAQIPWSAIAGMRDKLIHDYFGVNLDQVWLTATIDIPELKDGRYNHTCDTPTRSPTQPIDHIIKKKASELGQQSDIQLPEALAQSLHHNSTVIN